MPPRHYSRIFTVILEKEADGGYSVHCPALPGCVSQGEDRRAALANIKEAIGLVWPLLEKKGETPAAETPALLSKELRHILKGREQDGLPFAGVSLEPVKVSVKGGRNETLLLSGDGQRLCPVQQQAGSGNPGSGRRAEC